LDHLKRVFDKHIDGLVEQKLEPEREKFYDKANLMLKNLERDFGILRARNDEALQNTEKQEQNINALAKTIEQTQTKQEELEKVTNTLDRQTDLLERLTNLMEKIISEKFPKYSI